MYKHIKRYQNNYGHMLCIDYSPIKLHVCQWHENVLVFCVIYSFMIKHLLRLILFNRFLLENMKINFGRMKSTFARNIMKTSFGRIICVELK